MVIGEISWVEGKEESSKKISPFEAVRRGENQRGYEQLLVERSKLFLAGTTLIS
jgi:hypothetical protein